MTSSIPPDDISEADDKLFEEAARWHIRLRDPDAPSRVHDGFIVWVRKDPRHIEAYDRAEALWHSMQGDPMAIPRRDDAAIAALVAEGRARHPAVRVAAIIGLLLIGGLGWWKGADAYDSLCADYIAWTGERETIVLADGTRIELNSGTAIAVDFSRDQRRVRIFRGEAFFDVAHNVAKPFIVEMPEGQLRVTGTSFNVDLTGGAADIALLDGSVTLTARHGRGPQTILSPGQQATLRTAHISAPQGFDADTLGAWRHGKMIFYRTPLLDVLEELGRYHRGGILLVNDRAARLPVTGVFSTDDPAQVADIIAETLGLSVHRVPGSLTVVR